MCACVCVSEPRGSFFSLAVIVANSVSIDELPRGGRVHRGAVWLRSRPPSCLFLPTHQQKHREEVITEGEEEGELRRGRAVKYEDEKGGD